jgi:hypothetical protein
MRKAPAARVISLRAAKGPQRMARALRGVNPPDNAAAERVLPAAAPRRPPAEA